MKLTESVHINLYTRTNKNNKKEIQVPIKYLPTKMINLFTSLDMLKEANLNN